MESEQAVEKLAGDKLLMQILISQVIDTGTIDIEAAFSAQRQIVARFINRAGIETICDPDDGRVVYIGRLETPTKTQREFMRALSGEIYDSIRSTLPSKSGDCATGEIKSE